MLDVIIRIELRGEPGGDVYKKLHSYMSDEKSWSTRLIGEKGAIGLPHAMYSGSTSHTPLEVAAALKQHIEKAIWQPAIVLVIDWQAWGQAGS